MREGGRGEKRGGREGGSQLCYFTMNFIKCKPNSWHHTMGIYRSCLQELHDPGNPLLRGLKSIRCLCISED